MMRKTSSDKISNAKALANKALNIFFTTIDELNKSNDVLRNVVADEENKIDEHKGNIVEANYAISQNTEVIKKLQELVPNM